MDAFTARAAGDRALGWEMRDPKRTENSGTRMSAATFGHTGFTGTSLWIDPEHDVFVVLLTNRVYSPHTRTSLSQLKQIRGRAADAAVDLVCRLKSAEC
jgi:CubicO group peptidase (beta-lactamase class C family)